MDGLTRKLEATHDEIQRVRGEVVEALKAFYGGSSSLSADEALKIASRWSNAAKHPLLPGAVDASNVSDMDARVNRLAHALQDAVGQLHLDESDSSDQTRLITSFAQRERLKRQMDQSRRMLVVIEKVTHMDNALFDIDAHMDKGDVVAAAGAYVHAQQLFEGLDDTQCDPATPMLIENDDIVRILNLQLLKKRNRLIHVLDQAHSKVLTAKQGLLCAKQPRFYEGPNLGAGSSAMHRLLWQASALMSSLPSRLTDVAKIVSIHLLKPLLSSDCASLKVTNEADSVSLTLISPSENGTPKLSEIESADHICAQVVTALRFVYTEVFGTDVDIMQRATEFIWRSPGNLESQLLTYLQDKIPKDPSLIIQYRDCVTRVVGEMCDSLESFGFIIPRNSQVRVFSDQIDLLYSKRRRQQLLTIARGFMSRDYRNSTKVAAATERCSLDASVGTGKKDGGKGKLGTSGFMTGSSSSDETESGSFQMPDYRITHCAHDVVELAHQTLIEACTPDSIRANTLFHTSRDIFFLFRAVVPTLYQDEITNDASTCMLFHNDCMYIAHHMLTIGHHYKSRLPAPLNQIATMVDMVPPFREAGERALTAFAGKFSDELRSGMRTFKDEGGIDSPVALENLDGFIKASLYKLNHVRSSWRDGLPQGVYNQVMRLILQPFVTAFMEQMLVEKKIGATTGGTIHNIASLLLETQGMFDTAAQSEKYVPELAKLRRFTSLLVQPLTTIQDQFVNGDLVEFSSQELTVIARSIFRDSPERKELLRLIASVPVTKTL